MYIPDIDPRLIEFSEEITRQKRKEQKKKSIISWLSNNAVGIVALIISIISIVLK